MKGGAVPLCYISVWIFKILESVTPIKDGGATLPTGCAATVGIQYLKVMLDTYLPVEKDLESSLSLRFWPYTSLQQMCSQTS